MNIVERAADLLRSKGQQSLWEEEKPAEPRQDAAQEETASDPISGAPADYPAADQSTDQSTDYWARAEPGELADEEAEFTTAEENPPEETVEATPRRNAPAPPRGKQSNVISIDFAYLRSKGIIVPNAPRGHQIEEFRHVKQRVLNQRIDKSIRYPNTIMVTSSVPGEGKTHVATNLAISIALEHDMTVLLVDADFKRPGIPGRLGFKAKKGLIDVLYDPSIDVSEVLLKTDIESLSVIPAGQVHALSPELLTSARMDAIVRELADRYEDRVIIFDAPPLLATTEPSILATYVAQVIFVVEAERTRNSSIQAALELLNTSAHIGFVLNKVRPQFGSADFGHYSYYYNYKPTEPEATAK